jgi:segregation and condensation protein A
MPEISRFLDAGNFTGPFDLLLELAEKKNINLSHISLAAISGDYLEYVIRGKINPNDLAEFIKIASKLIFIKSASLSPSLSKEKKERVQEFADLKLKLEIFSCFKKKARYLSSIFNKTPSFSRPSLENIVLNKEGEQLGEGRLADFLKKMIKNIPDLAVSKKVIRKSLRLEVNNLILRIKELFLKEKKISFFDFSQNMDKIEVAVTFLALLEIAKKMEIDLSQNNWGEDICLEN